MMADMNRSAQLSLEDTMRDMKRMTTMEIKMKEKVKIMML